MMQQKDGDGGVTLNERTPSFFQSPSLVCMGGLNVLDPFETVQSVDEEKKEAVHDRSKSSVVQISEHVDVTSGWGGFTWQSFIY